MLIAYRVIMFVTCVFSFLAILADKETKASFVWAKVMVFIVSASMSLTSFIPLGG